MEISIADTKHSIAALSVLGKRSASDLILTSCADQTLLQQLLARAGLALPWGLRMTVVPPRTTDYLEDGLVTTALHPTIPLLTVYDALECPSVHVRNHLMHLRQHVIVEGGAEACVSFPLSRTAMRARLMHALVC